MNFFCSGVYSPDYDNCSNVQYVNKQPRRLRKGDFGSDRDLNHDSLPMIPHQVETQFIASQPFPVPVSGLIPSLSAAPAPCWFRKCQNQAMVTQTVREYPHQLAFQTQGLHDTPRSQQVFMGNQCGHNGQLIAFYRSVHL